MIHGYFTTLFLLYNKGRAVFIMPWIDYVSLNYFVISHILMASMNKSVVCDEELMSTFTTNDIDLLITICHSYEWNKTCPSCVGSLMLFCTHTYTFIQLVHPIAFVVHISKVSVCIYILCADTPLISIYIWIYMCIVCNMFVLFIIVPSWCDVLLILQTVSTYFHVCADTYLMQRCSY